MSMDTKENQKKMGTKTRTHRSISKQYKRNTSPLPKASEISPKKNSSPSKKRVDSLPSTNQEKKYRRFVKDLKKDM